MSAYKRSPGAAEEARVTIDPDSGEIIVYAQELDEDGNVTREWEDTPDDFGRIAAQTAKQVIAQRLREAKREQVFDVYEGREGDLVTGIVQQVDNRYAILDLGDAEAIMPGSERIPYERLDRGNRVKALILEVRNEAKGPQIVVSRSHPDLVRRLLELEVPELVDGTIEIVGTSPGSPATGRRSPSSATTRTWIPRGRASARADRGSVRWSTSCAARRSTSSSAGRTRPSSSPRHSARPRSKRCGSTTRR